MQVSFFPFPAIARADRKTAELRNQKVEWFSSVQTERRNDRPRSPSISSRPQYEPPSSSSAAAADNLLFPVTADFESAESILLPSVLPSFLLSDFHASHAFTAFTAGIDITWTKADGRTDVRTRAPRPKPSLSSRPASPRARART